MTQTDGDPHPAGVSLTPYVGLVPYREEDAEFFFGRDEETGIVAGNLRASRLTIVYGASGVGKSSLLQAGVIRELHERVLENLKTPGARAPFAVCSFGAWRDDPLRALVREIWGAAVEATGGQDLPGWQPGEPLLDVLRGWTARVRTLLVVLDQFEDYFLYHPDEDGPGTFADVFPAIVNDVNLRVHFVVAIREDSWAKLDRFEDRIPRLFENYLRIEQLTPDAAREAIEGPIEQWNRRLPEAEHYTVEPALVDAVIDAAAWGRVGSGESAEPDAPDRARPDASDGGRPDAIEAPFLQLVMNRMWVATVQAGARELTRSRLESLGGAERIVANHLQDALGGLTGSEQPVAADAFRYLVTRTNTKIAHPASDLADWTKRPEPEVTAVLEKLCRGDGGRILRQVHPPGGEATRYELFHDVLAEPILDWRRGYEQRRARRRALRVGTALLAVIAVFAGLAVWALAQRQHAQTEATNARSLALATAANSALAASPSAAVVLSLAALAPYRAGPSSPTSALATTIKSLQKAQSQRLFGVLQPEGSLVNSVAFSPDDRTLAEGNRDGTVQLWNTVSRTLIASLPAGSGNHVISVAFSPDGRTLAAGTRVPGTHGGTVLLWDTATHTRLASLPTGSGNLVNSVAFSPDGHTLAAGTNDGTLLWNTANRTRLALLPAGSGNPVNSVAFSPDGHTLAAGTNDGTLLWDTANRTRLASLSAATAVNTVAFSPDGRTLAAGTGDVARGVGAGTVLLWNTATHTRLASLSSGAGGPVAAVAFSPDRRTLAAGTNDGKVLLWNTASLTKPTSLPAGSGNPVLSVAFSPDRRTLATGTGDGTVLLWNAASVTKPTSLPAGSDNSVNAVAFSPDGRTLAAGTNDGTVLLWDTANRTRLASLPAGSRNPVAGVAFSPDGRTLAAGHVAVRLWDTANRTRLASLPAGSRNYVSAVAFSPDGRTLATGTGDGTVLLWNTANWTRLASLPAGGSRYKVTSVAFSPDGRTVAAGTSNRIGFGKLLLWDTANRTRLASLSADSSNSAVNAVAFSPDGRTLAAGTYDGTVLLWDTANRKRLASLSAGSSNIVYSVAFSPDGRTLAAGTYDGTVLLWGTANHIRLASLAAGSSNAVLSVAFSPDGRTLAAGTDSGTVHLLPLLGRNFAALRDEICGLVPGGGLTRAVWRTYAPGLSYEDDCH